VKKKKKCLLLWPVFYQWIKEEERCAVSDYLSHLFFHWGFHGDQILLWEIPSFLVSTTILGMLCIRFFIYLASRKLYPAGKQLSQHLWGGDSCSCSVSPYLFTQPIAS
jgi:hypothetical protein